ncbi:hypothetical protein BHM03_00042014 [Ensete ventricosum]|nr:hypothetical protein BHM03_00042014 [Ensete ventricosum]
MSTPDSDSGLLVKQRQHRRHSVETRRADSTSPRPSSPRNLVAAVVAGSTCLLAKSERPSAVGRGRLPEARSGPPPRLLRFEDTPLTTPRLLPLPHHVSSRGRPAAVVHWRAADSSLTSALADVAPHADPPRPPKRQAGPTLLRSETGDVSHDGIGRPHDALAEACAHAHVSKPFFFLVFRSYYPVAGEGSERMNGSDLVLPPGFRFHPTDEELVVHYLLRRCGAQPIPAPVVAEVDLYKYDPWQLPGRCAWSSPSRPL